MKKYIILKEDKIKVFGITLFRIKRISNGLIGGYIEAEKNLSHYGNAWVSGDAWVSKLKECINVTSLPFNITITKNHTKIGCKQKIHEEWFDLSELEASKLGLDKKHYTMFLTLLITLVGYVVED